MRSNLAALAFGMLLVAVVGAAQESPAPARLALTSIAVGTGIANRELVGQAESFPADVGQLTCLTRVEGAPDETAVTHVWLLGEHEMRRVELAVKSSSWRTWSQKNVKPGSWTVKVLDAGGAEIGKVSFSVGP
jgi:hypothetical protein